MTHAHAKGQGQRSQGSTVRVKTDGQMDGGNCITYHANVVYSKVEAKHIQLNFESFFMV